MAILDHNGESEFPFRISIVFDAVCKAIPTLDGMQIENADQLTHRVMVKAGMTLWSWGENIPIQLISITNTKTKVQITSSPKTGVLFGGASDMGKNRKNIERIIAATSKILSTLEPEIEESEILLTNNSSVADELIKLKKLLDEGILTQEEFSKQKSKLLV